MSEMSSIEDYTSLVINENPDMGGSNSLTTAEGLNTEEISDLSGISDLPEPDSLVNGLENTQASAMIDALNSLPPSPDLPALTDLMNPESDFPTLSDEEEYIDSDDPDYCTWLDECKRPCYVLLTKLSDEEIERATPKRYYLKSSSDEEQRLKYKLAIRSSRDPYKIKRKQLEEYKRKRENFLQKKRRWSSDVDHGLTSSNDDYHPPDSFNKDRRKRKKKLAYEDDMDWNPKLERDNIPWKCSTTKGRKSEKLRITTRRRRIETDSESDSDFDYETYMYDYPDEDASKEPASEGKTSDAMNGAITAEIYDPAEAYKPSKKTVKKKKPKAKEKRIPDNTQDSMHDHDVYSYVLKEYEENNMKPGKKLINSIYNGVTNKQPSTWGSSKNNSQKRKHIRVKINKLPPTVCAVQSVVKDMMNEVCEKEDKAKKPEEATKKCRWCTVDFDPKNTKDELCVICKDTINFSSLPGSQARKSSTSKKKSITKGKVNKAKSKMNEKYAKIMKKLPKYEQQRLQYSEKSFLDKGYNHCKSYSLANEDSVVGPRSDDKILTKKKDKAEPMKLKKSQKIKSKKTTFKSTGKKDKTLSVRIKTKPTNLEVQVNRSILPKDFIQKDNKKQNNVSVHSVDKGLFLMTFPSPDKQLEVPQRSTPEKSPIKAKTVSVPISQGIVPTPSQPSTINPLPSTMSQSLNTGQYGSYLVPSAPTMVVANYSASNNVGGDFVLSSLYYPNESSNSVSTSNSLSMPTINDLTLLGQNIPTNPYQTAYVGLPPNTAIRPPLNNVTRNPVGIPSNVIVRNIQPQMSPVNPVHNQLYMTNSMVPNNNNSQPVINYPTQSELNKLINRCGLQISPASVDNSSSINSSVFSNPALQVPNNNSVESDISRLINNCGLEITPAKVNTMSYESNNIINSSMPIDESYPSIDRFTPLISDYELTLAPPATDNSQIMSNDAFSNQNSKLQGIDFNVSNSDNEGELQIDMGNVTLDMGSNTLITKEVNKNTEKIALKDTETGRTFKEQEQSETNTSGNKQDDFEDILEKDLREISALAILSILDLEDNPRISLLLRVEQSEKIVKQLSEDKTKHNEYLKALNNVKTLNLAKKWLKRFGTFARLSQHYLKEDENQTLKTPIQIKKEHIEEEEEEMSSCQFSQQSSSMNLPQANLNDFASSVKVKTVNLNACQINTESVPNLNPIASLETQVDSIADQLNSAGVDCTTIPIPGIALSSNNVLVPPNIPRTDMIQDSRETPSRGSGPRTPARPESAASHIDDSFLTPVQIKKERMETVNQPYSQCAFSGNNNPHTPALQAASPALGSISSITSPSLSEVLSQGVASQPVSVQSNLQQVAIQSSSAYRASPMTSGQNFTPNVSLVPNSQFSGMISNQSGNISIRTVPQNTTSPQLTNFVGSSGYAASVNVPTGGISNHSTNFNSNNNFQIQNYQSQVPPNRTAPFNANQNYSKVIMNVVSKNMSQTPSVSVSGSNTNVIFNAAQQAGQVYMQQQQQLQQANQVYNVQQVYLPNKTPLLQQSLQPTQSPIPQQSTSQYIIRQNPNSVATSLAGGAVLLNSSSIQNSSVQPSQVYPVQNSVVTNYPVNQNTATLSSSNSILPGAYLLKNESKQPSGPCEVVGDMFCAMCNKVATLRCKQCGKVAYCNPSCAKTYWHTKHKMECRPIQQQ